MPDNIIARIKEAERQADERESEARRQAEDEIRAAALEADRKIKNAEADAEAAVRTARQKGAARAAEIKKKHEDAARSEAENLILSAKERKNEAVAAIVQELIGQWQ